MAEILPHRHVTTDRTLARDLKASVKARGVDAGLTWGDFKLAMYRLGVRDDDALASIEYGTALTTVARICRDDSEDGIEIRGVR